MTARWTHAAKRKSAALGLVALGALLSPGPATAQQAAVGPSAAEFRDPPQSARPRVWWHWLNGNVTQDGIRKDLEWMKRVGIGGVQTFDINFFVPTIVKDRLLYMTPAWQEAFRLAATETDRLGLELTIASSPGWSLTGGPWVKPADGMKKLVWSETRVRTGHRGALRLEPPPTVSGPFLDIPMTPEAGSVPAGAAPVSYSDVAVYAYPADSSGALPLPSYTTGDGMALDAGLLTDGKFAGGVALKRSAAGSAAVTIRYESVQTVRSLSLYVPGSADTFGGATARGVLEASQDGTAWSTVAEFSPTMVPSTIGFAPVSARYFRLSLTGVDNSSPADSVAVPGYAGINYAAFLRARPFQLAELRLSPTAYVHQFEAKAGFAVARNYAVLDTVAGRDEAGIDPSRLVELTDRLRPDGTLDWQPPAGEWRILRLGSSLTGKTNHPAPTEATGLEVDKLDGEAVRGYMANYLASYRATVGDGLIGRHGINAILTDSTEVGAFNWTPRMREAFARLRGYDPRPWLPALAGIIVGSRAQSDRFLYDYRRTISDLHASEHYGSVASAAHAAGLKVYGEALEGWRVSLGDDIDMRGSTDIPMAAMWAFPAELGPRPLLVADLRTAAASAHLRGLPLVAAESMTSSRYPWAQGPADLRRVVDTEFANGINRIVIHTSPHQPVDDKQPGLSLRHIGQFFTRHETWADMARPWIDYIARSSYLLQQGRFAADVAYFMGEDALAGTLASDGRLADVPKQFAYDFVNATTILKHFAVDKGDLTTPGGARYRVLYLSGDSQRMTLPLLRQLASLAEQGATIVGTAPSASPSLADDQAEFAALVRRLWSGQPITLVGKGRVVAGQDLSAALAMLGVSPAVTMSRTESRPDAGPLAVDFVDRELPDGRIYFVRNGGQAFEALEARFRISGRVPEIWDAVTGTIDAASYRMDEQQTVVPLTLAGEQSKFIVFRQPTTVRALVKPDPRIRVLAQLDADWSVAFQPGRGAPATLSLSALAPLNENAAPGVRYFSGVAQYSRTFSRPKGIKANRPLWLDLGAVGDIAEVIVNGKAAGTLWTKPYRLDIGRLVVRGRNQLEVRVANLWANRLIGDAQPGAAKVGWTSTPMYRADAPLRLSGLAGPVTISAEM